MELKGKITILISNILLLIGIFVYHNMEGWNWIDSFYFTPITLTTKSKQKYKYKPKKRK